MFLIYRAPLISLLISNEIISRIKNNCKLSLLFFTHLHLKITDSVIFLILCESKAEAVFELTLRVQVR